MLKIDQLLSMDNICFYKYINMLYYIAKLIYYDLFA
jgi:hypothetical protein